ncbi:hypothetical protein ACSHXN_44595 (plasmid) [Streptomyces sp. HUAS TT11]
MTSVQAPQPAGVGPEGPDPTQADLGVSPQGIEAERLPMTS